MTDITYSKLRDLGFKPWDDDKEPNETSWLLESDYDGHCVKYDYELHSWLPDFRVTLVWKRLDRHSDNHPIQYGWECTTWWSDSTNKEHPIFRRCVVDNIASVEDIQKTMEICGIDKKII